MSSLAIKSQQHGPPIPSVFFVLGGPGAGKATLRARIVKEFVCTQLSVSDLLQKEAVDPASQHGKTISGLMQEGKSVPADIVLGLLEKAIRRNSWQGLFVLDGLPRNFRDVQAWVRVIGEKVNIKGYIFLDCEEEVLEQRLLESSRRTGEDVHCIRNRINAFYDESMAFLVQHLEREGKMFRIDARQSAEEVWMQAKDVLVSAGSPLRCVSETQKTTLPRGASSTAGSLQLFHHYSPVKATQLVASNSAEVAAEWTSTHNMAYKHPPFQRFAPVSHQSKTKLYESWLPLSPRTLTTSGGQAASLRMAGSSMLTPR
eukprot:TRINITY_DN46089_c0_g1_i1.p1 TRINITY_DN46089_c0_g1~~TRINITY_DN46089_c0_g1_i1.p1  ORF type:complete len:322 (-),score=68.48 TRINITY_DN46089_c0_g1_i1:14-958(-)